MDQDVRQGIDELLYFQSGLLREKDTLKKLLTKIDEQIHALQVEQLHLISSMNASMKMKDNTMCTKSDADNNTSGTLLEKDLDLTVRNLGNYSEEEEDNDEDDDDNDMRIKIHGDRDEEENDMDFINF